MPARILVVDDERPILESLALLLSYEGFEAITARDVAAALRITRAQPVDLILADVMMPGLDGFDLVDELRNGGDRTPVLLMSAAADLVHLRVDVPIMRKPFDAEELLAAIRRMLSPRSHGAE